MWKYALVYDGHVSNSKLPQVSQKVHYKNVFLPNETTFNQIHQIYAKALKYFSKDGKFVTGMSGIEVEQGLDFFCGIE